MPNIFPDVRELSSQQLLDHWRRAAALWADIDKVKFSRQEVLDFSKFLIREIWKRDAATFNTKGQKSSTVDLFHEAAKDIAFDGLMLRKPHGERVVAGEKKLVVKSKTFPGMVGRPVSLVSDSKIVGIVTLAAPEELTEGEFEKRRAQHTITDAERVKWWGKKMPLWGYRFAVNAVFDPPIRLDTAKAARFIMKDDKTQVGLFEGLLPVYPSHEGDRVQSFELEDFARFWGEPAMLFHGCALAVGSCVTQGGSDNDLDVVLRAPTREQLLDDMAFRLGRAIPLDELRQRIQFLSDRPNPITSYVPLFDLVMVPRQELKVFMMQMLRDAKLQREARASEAEDEVRPDRMVFPIKPQRGAVEGQLQTIPNFLKLFAEKDFPLLVSKKYDGARHLVFKSDKVRIISDDGEDNTKRLPRLVKLFENIPGKFVVDTEIELWDGKKHLPREAAAGAVKRGDDENLFANIFDVLYWNGDVHKDSSFARHELLSREMAGRNFVESTLKAPTKPINLAPQLEAKDKAELRELTERISKEPGSEGVVAKSGPYELDGDSKTWWKYHLAGIAPVVILRRIETKAKGIFNYLFGLAYDGDLELKREQKLGDETFLVVGKTFNTVKRFRPGDIVDVEFETLNWIEEDGKLDVTFWVPSLLDRSKSKGPMEAEDAAKLAERNRVLVRKRVKDGKTLIEKTIESSGVRQIMGSEGGKHFAAAHLLKFVPPHKTYVEPFCGGAALFWKKPKSEREVLNDKNPLYTRIYRGVRDAGEAQLGSMVFVGEVSRSHWDRLSCSDSSPASARDGILKIRTSFNSQGNSYKKIGVHVTIDKSSLQAWHERLRGARCHCEDAMQTIKCYDSAETFFFVDPPYPECNAQIAKNYSWADFKQLVDVLRSCKGKFFITMHDRSEARRILSGLHIRTFPIRNVGIVRDGRYVKDETSRREIMAANFPLDKQQTWWRERTDYLRGLKEQRGNPYLDFPKRNVPVPAMLHFHWRGKSVHGDIRMLVNFSKKWPDTESVAEASRWVKGARQRGELSGSLVGWTLNIQKAGKVKKDVESLTQARGLVAGWSRDKGGRVLKSFTASGLGGIHLVTETKAREPIEWLNFEASVPKGAVGATKEKEGILHIADRFWVKLGAQKPDFHEYFVTGGGKLNGRLVVRLLENVFGPERAGRGKFVWMSWFTKAKLPFVLSKRAAEDRYLPLKGHSALPVIVEKAIPRDLQYWRMDRAQALKARDLIVGKRLVREGDFGEKANGEITFKDEIGKRRSELKEAIDTPVSEEVLKEVMDALKKKDAPPKWLEELLQLGARDGKICPHHFRDGLLIDGCHLCEQKADFTYSRRSFKGPVVIRFGPSREEFHLYLKTKGRGLRDLVSPDSLLTNDAVSAILEELDDIRWLEFEGDIPPGAPGNPTKDTPAEQKILAQGQATILQDTDTFVKFELQSEELSGLFVAKRRKNEELWDVEKTASVGEPASSGEAGR